jgi:uncharacterized membrane protein YbhN (UPF0104 family)
MDVSEGAEVPREWRKSDRRPERSDCELSERERSEWARSDFRSESTRKSDRRPERSDCELSERELSERERSEWARSDFRSEPASIAWREGLRSEPIRIARALLTALATAGLVGALAWRLDLAAMGQTLAQVHLGWLLLAAALGPLQVGLSALRWRLASRAVGHHLPHRVALREFALSALLNQLLPGGVAGDVLRAVRVREGAAPFRSARIVLIDRIVGLSVHLVVVIVGVALWRLVHPGVAAPWPVAALALGLLGVFGAGLLSPGVLGYEARQVMAGGRGLAQLGLSGLLTASFLLGFACSAQALGLAPGALLLTAVPLVLLSMALPLTLGGWGLREWTAAAVLAPLGIDAETAVSWSVVYGISVLLGSLLAAGPALLGLLSRERP